MKAKDQKIQKAEDTKIDIESICSRGKAGGRGDNH